MIRQKHKKKHTRYFFHLAFVGILFRFLLLDLLHVEIKFFALENVTIASAILAWSRGNTGEHTSGLKLLFESLLDFSATLLDGDLLLRFG